MPSSGFAPRSSTFERCSGSKLRDGNVFSDDETLQPCIAPGVTSPSGVPSTAIVRPPRSMAVVWATVSTPSANPLSTVMSRFTNSETSRRVLRTPAGDGWRDPTTEAMRPCAKIDGSPATQSCGGTCFHSISFSGPIRSSTDLALITSSASMGRICRSGSVTVVWRLPCRAVIGHRFRTAPSELAAVRHLIGYRVASPVSRQLVMPRFRNTADFIGEQQIGPVTAISKTVAGAQ